MDYIESHLLVGTDHRLGEEKFCQSHLDAGSFTELRVSSHLLEFIVRNLAPAF